MSNFPIDVCSVPTEHKAIIWGVFAKNGHYMDGKGQFNKGSECYIGVDQDTREPLLFCSTFRYYGMKPNELGSHRSAWRTDDEGLICAFSDAIGEMLMLKNIRFLPNIPPGNILGEYREATTRLWRPTVWNLKERKHAPGWITYKHEFLGGSGSFIAA